jgi:hypothetical protein
MLPARGRPAEPGLLDQSAAHRPMQRVASSTEAVCVDPAAADVPVEPAWSRCAQAVAPYWPNTYVTSSKASAANT